MPSNTSHPLTQRLHFHACGPLQESLFEVRAGIPCSDALTTATGLLAIAQTLAYKVAEDTHSEDAPDIACAVAKLVEFASALTESCERATFQQGGAK